MKKSLLLLPILLLGACTRPEAPKDYTAWVDPMIGTGGHGHVFVGANVPFGWVQVGPTSIPQQWDWCSGYHESDNTCIGFSHTHLEGTGIGDLFDVTVMPVTGEVTYARGTEDDLLSGLWSYADRTKEVAEPGYYTVPLIRYGITAEMTATNRVGMHRYTFPADETSAIVFDLENGGCWDRAYKTDVRQESDHSISGCRHSTGWARDQRLFFYAEFSRPFDSFEPIVKSIRVSREDFEDQIRFARLNFKTEDGEQILVKVALSSVSVDGAKANMAAELPEWDFDGTRAAAKAAWNKELSRIDVETADETSRTIFYTALFHSMIHPSAFCDVSGDYRGADLAVHTGADYTYSTVFSLWDTYRAMMPLSTFLHADRMKDWVKTMVAVFDESGKVPVWHLMGNETDCMVGNPGCISVADAIVKGFDIDREHAYEAIKESVMLDERGQNLRKQYGYIPVDLYNEGLANDFEYAIADAAVARAAEALGKSEDAAFFTERSHSYRYYMDPETQLARGRLADKSWRTPFNPFLSNHREQDYCEGNAWQYTWLVPQDYAGLVEFYGSRENFVARLDTLFAQKSEIEGDNASPDIAGLIGQYAHGNEPSHHIIYFYTMAGEPAKTADKVREVYETMYFNNPNGLSGNEDEGQMSSWYILSALGFYQVEPAVPRYWFGAPLFEKMSVKVPGGTLVIKADGLTKENRYIQDITLNGKPHKLPYITYDEICRGGTLTYKMGPERAKWFE